MTSSFKRKLSAMQELMVKDGMPRELMFTAEERAEAWLNNPPKPPEMYGKKEIKEEVNPPKTKIIELTDRKKSSNKPASEKIDLTDKRWDPRTGKFVEDKWSMIAIKTNTRGKGKPAMTKTNFNDMTSAELVAKFNEMAASGVVQNAKPVKRFADRDSAIKRCVALEDAIIAITAQNTNVETNSSDEGKDNTVATKKAKKSKSVTKPKRKEPTGNQSKIAVEFGAREGSNREKLIDALAEFKGKFVGTGALLKKVYGSMNEDNKGALNMVLKGMVDMIDKHKLPYKIMKEKNEKEITIGLFPKR